MSVVLPGLAAAADDVRMPVPERFADASTFDWSGARLGINGGYGWSDYGVIAGDGGFVGLHGGYDMQFGQGVVGVEGSAAIADIEIAPGNKLESVIDLRARFGVSLDRVLVYGTAGGVYGTTNTGLNDTGWVAGAGVDFAATKRTIAGMEYVRYRFDNFANTGAAVDVDLIKGKFTYKF